MSDNYAVLKVSKYHTFPQLHGLQKHHQREINLPHVDYSKSIQNVNLIEPGGSYINAWKTRLQNAELEFNKKITVRKNAVIFLEVVMSYSHDADVPLKEWTNKNLEWLKNKFGEDNIFACTLHMDESTPHIHAEIIPIDNRGHLCARSFIDGKYSLHKLQSDYADNMQEFGLVRGEKHSKAKQKTLNEFYKALNQIDKNPFPPQLDDEDEEQYLLRLQKYIKDLKLAMYDLQLKADRSNDIINSRIDNKFFQYKNALDLQDTIMANFDNQSAALDRLLTYQSLEQSVPRQELDKVLSFLKDKYSDNQNILSIINNLEL